MSRLQENPYGVTMAGPSANMHVPVVPGGDHNAPLTSQSYHSNTENSFASTPPDWNAFADPNAAAQDDGGSQATPKPKKKGTKGKKAAAEAKGTGNTSPKAKKKKAVGNTAIDRDGFLVGGEGKPKKLKDQLAKSTHSSASDGNVVKKKVTKKKVVKKSAGDGSVPTSKPKKKKAAS